MVLACSTSAAEGEEGAPMAGETLTTDRPSHGAAAGALKWGFKSYFRARQAIGEVVAEARAEFEATRSPDADALPAPIAGGSDERRVNRTVSARGEPMAAPKRRSDDRMVVRWFSEAGAEERPA